MTTVKVRLQELVADFKKWLATHYTEQEIKDLRTDDPGYPEWHNITNFFAGLLKNNQISTLDTEDQKTYFT